MKLKMRRNNVFAEWKRLLGGLKCEKYCICRVKTISARLEMLKVLYLSSENDICEAQNAKSIVFLMGLLVFACPPTAGALRQFRYTS